MFPYKPNYNLKEFSIVRSPKPWAKLVSISPIFENASLYEKSYLIGSEGGCDIVIKNENVNSAHCNIYLSENTGDVILNCFAEKGIYVNKQLVDH